MQKPCIALPWRGPFLNKKGATNEDSFHTRRRIKKGLQMKSEMQANQALANMAEERMRWVAVLGEKPASKRPAPRKGFRSLVFGF